MKVNMRHCLPSFCAVLTCYGEGRSFKCLLYDSAYCLHYCHNICDFFVGHIVVSFYCSLWHHQNMSRYYWLSVNHGITQVCFKEYFVIGNFPLCEKSWHFGTP
eukprot:NODE_1103_length_1157_cov_0.056711.p3 type:complete len:103 gc:universal NODE_1103_length_1157_cov_0.056711:602-910(+)